MEVVIDANEVISALISSSGKTAEIIFSGKLKLFAPEYLLGEINNHKSEILQKSGLSKAELDMLLSLIFLNIEFIPFFEFEKFEEEASKICQDPNDTEYFSLALKLGCSIWSNDKRLKEQNKVKVYNTTELIGLLK
ncbi:DNA-binding protein [Candidatus Pacearchaeota archaeon]|nr:DNA-binding protein [Candidatus Pacearchaeota archaeon]